MVISISYDGTNTHSVRMYIAKPHVFFRSFAASKGAASDYNRDFSFRVPQAQKATRVRWRHHKLDFGVGQTPVSPTVRRFRSLATLFARLDSHRGPRRLVESAPNGRRLPRAPPPSRKNLLSLSQLSEITCRYNPALLGTALGSRPLGRPRLFRRIRPTLRLRCQHLYLRFVGTNLPTRAASGRAPSPDWVGEPPVHFVPFMSFVDKDTVSIW